MQLGSVELCKYFINTLCGWHSHDCSVNYDVLTSVCS